MPSGRLERSCPAKFILGHLVAGGPQKPGDRDAKLDVVVDDVDHGGHDRSPRRRVGKPEGDAEGRACAASILGRYPPRMSFDDRPRDRRPHPRAVAFGREGIEHPVQLLTGNTGRRIRDGRLDRRSVDASGAATIMRCPLPAAPTASMPFTTRLRITCCNFTVSPLTASGASEFNEVRQAQGRARSESRQPFRPLLYPRHCPRTQRPRGRWNSQDASHNIAQCFPVATFHIDALAERHRQRLPVRCPPANSILQLNPRVWRIPRRPGAKPHCPERP